MLQKDKLMYVRMNEKMNRKAKNIYPFAHNNAGDIDIRFQLYKKTHSLNMYIHYTWSHSS